MVSASGLVAPDLRLGPVTAAIGAPRIRIESVTPCVDEGQLPAKGIVGQTIAVEVDIFMDGHDLLAARLIWRGPRALEEQSTPMTSIGNDRWRAQFTPAQPGRHRFNIEAWRDDWGSYRNQLQQKSARAVPPLAEVDEGRRLLAAAVAAGAAGESALNFLRRLQGMDEFAAAQSLLSPEAASLMARLQQRRFVTHLPADLIIEVERLNAGFASWYELFPRSQAQRSGEHGTFDDVIARLPALRAMGFDVLCLPPIHPIGRSHRQGGNNSLQAGPEDPGNPYAIGAVEGGHTAIHPELGGLDAFRRLLAAAETHGIEVALDFAVQCSRDHPWLLTHPEWFSWHADGSMREDIVNVDFYAEQAKPALWLSLRDVVLHWVEIGIRTFRVDNPHTKPLPFWQWLIADIRARHPDVIFLSEAFTRPLMMYRLAKIGFAQSYTYFIWRNRKRELTDYFTELTTQPCKDFLRPHLFVNTPDINPYFLQNSGRAGFLIRAALAATLSGLWGMYSGFELCEAAPLPGREEYLDSEKYQIKQRDWQAPGNIIAEISRLNHIRRSNPALQTHRSLRFYNAVNDQVLWYGKATPGLDNFILSFSRA